MPDLFLSPSWKPLTHAVYEAEFSFSTLARFVSIEPWLAALAVRRHHAQQNVEWGAEHIKSSQLPAA